MKYLRFIVFAVSYAALFVVYSSAATPLLRALTPDQGLSQGSIRDLLIDDQGFLWLATNAGINRYDSNKVLQPKAVNYSLNEMAFSTVIQDSQQQIWAATDQNGIYRFDSELAEFELAVRQQQLTDTPDISRTISLVEYDDKHILALVDDSLYLVSTDHVNPEDARIKKLFSLTDQGIKNGWLRNSYVYKSNIFIASFRGVYYLDMATDEVTLIPHLTTALLNKDASRHNEQRHVKYLNVQHKRLWVGTVDGLYSIDIDDIQHYLQYKTPYTPKLNLENYNIWQIIWQQDKALMATNEGIVEYTLATGETRHALQLTQSNHSLYDDNIVDIVADDYGGFWLASRDDGAYYWHSRGQAFTNISRAANTAYSLSNEKVYSIAAVSNKDLWVGTSNGLNHIDLTNKKVSQYLLNTDLKAIQHGSYFHKIFPANDNKNLWLVTSDGLGYFDTSSYQLSPAPSLSNHDAQVLAQARYYFYKHKDLLYFSDSQQFYRYNLATAELVALPSISKVIDPANYGAFLGSINNNEQLLVSDADQLWLYDTRSKTIELVYQHQPYRPHLGRSAESMIIENNTIWVGFVGLGVLGFDATNLDLTHNVDSTKSQNIAYDLQLDSSGHIWFSSHQGLSRLNPKQLYTEHFTKADGLLSHEYNSGAATSLADGRLVYGSMHGITIVNPQALDVEEQQPKIIITSLSTQTGESIDIEGNLNQRKFKLSHQDLGIELQFSSMNFRDAHKMQYHFWLEGKQSLSFPIQNQNKVNFPQLSPGDYIFNVAAVSPTNGRESKAAQLFLTIKPAPWLSNWALACYTIILLAIAYIIIHTRLKQHRFVKQAHARIAESEQRLQQALATVDSGVWEWRASNEQIYASKVLSILGYPEHKTTLTIAQHKQLIHPDDLDGFILAWKRFLQQPDMGFDHSYRLQHNDGRWFWFRVMGKAVRFEHNNHIEQVLGTFSNITETRATSEKARLFGEAFQQTRDWVVIMDHQQRLVAANQSFGNAFGNKEQHLTTPKPHHLGISLSRRRYYTNLLKKLSVGEHWQGEEMVITPDGRERPTLINVSVVGDQPDKPFYVLVFTDITEQKLAEAELRYLANYDALTGLPNRALLMDRIYHGIDHAKRNKKSITLCFIDLDRFKQINDSLGHDIGDLLLKEVSRRLTLSLRESDSVSRLGGDEFVVLLEDYKNEDNISHVARKILSVISEPMLLGSHTVGVSPSIGIALYPQDALTANELLKHADVAMYHAKAAGRNNFQFFTPEMNEKAHMQLARETQLRQGIQQDEFFNVYQPIIDNNNRQVVGAEVLLRWRTAEGMKSPAEFIPLAEELRLIINMTQRLLERALADLKHWHNQGHKIYLSVNLSTQHLEQPALAEHTRLLLEKYNISAKYLCYEVTESALMRDHESAIKTMQALSDLGIKLALDDFGTGYSSLKYLKELPIDGIKIDRSFVKDIGIDVNDETIIEAILSMASSLGMYCIAEGVETEPQLAFFSQRNCSLIQGFLFSKPMASDDLLQFLQLDTIA
ncbi:EAL domain-containing protein [Rheinheimera sp. WS51]|uniref:EAL domain-containing protein n=1 Tax=Rheinheimera sp. WS51 TaxID=3425886 RepID=UPI003D8C9073